MSDRIRTYRYEIIFARGDGTNTVVTCFYENFDEAKGAACWMARPTKDTTTVVQHVDPGLPRDEDVMQQ